MKYRFSILLATMLSNIALASDKDITYDPEGYSFASILFNSCSFHCDYIKGADVSWRSQLANDALYTPKKDDRAYTNSMRVTKYFRINEAFYLDTSNFLNPKLHALACDKDARDGVIYYENCKNDSLPSFNEGNYRMVEYSMTYGHHLYTPDDYKGRYDNGLPDVNVMEPQKYDRPFASWVYVSQNLTTFRLDGYDQHSVYYGMVGRGAEGQWVQENAHKYPFSSTTYIPGWRTQVKNKLAIQYTGKYAYELSNARLFDKTRLKLRAYSLLDVGSIFRRGGGGVEIEIGLYQQPNNCIAFTPEFVGLGGYIKVFGRPPSWVEDYSKYEGWLNTFEKELGNHNITPNSSHLYDIENLRVDISEHRELSFGTPHDQSESDELARKIKGEVDRIKSEVRNNIPLAACQPEDTSWTFLFSRDWQYVDYNYLIEGGINVPANTLTQAQADSLQGEYDSIIVSGGKLGVNLKRNIRTTKVGVEYRWKTGSVSYTLNQRTKETEQAPKDHFWGEIGFQTTWDLGYLALPIFLATTSTRNYIKNDGFHEER